MRVISQFQDGESATVIKPTFSIRSTELDQFRAILESMAKDLAASVNGRNHMKPAGQAQGTPQNNTAQLPQQVLQQPPQQQPQQSQSQQSTPAPLNAANLEKNAQAHSKKMTKGGNKANQNQNQNQSQAPAAPTASQPPFSFGGAAASPHGNPNYIGKASPMNLRLPPVRKKQKLANDQPGQATPSPKTSKNASPEMQRAAEPQPPPKPVFLCKDPECDKSSLGFASDKNLQKHVEEEHTKPRENPMKFVGEILASALGLESDGTMKKDPKLAAPAMSTTNSKQGQTPGALAATPKSQDASMKRSASGLGKPSDKGGKGGMVSKTSDPKQTEAAAAAAPDLWANATIDPQTLLRNLGFENGIPGVINDMNAFRSLTPKDTPESSKDGASEPNSDISDGAVLDIDLRWQSLDTDLLFDLNNANLEEDMPALDAMLDQQSGTHHGPGGINTMDWGDAGTDFLKPFQFDTSLYSMSV